MTSHNILITGASGYLGGSLLHLIAQNSHILQSSASTPNSTQKHSLYALVRTQDQAEKVRKYGAEPLTFATSDESAIREAVLKYDIDIVFFLIDAGNSTSQVYFINALAELKKNTGREVHLLHTSGAKVFSSWAGAPTDEPLLDANPNMFDIQKNQKPPSALFNKPIETNNTIIETAERSGVRSYIFIPCVVYGKGLGFGNPISIQTVAIVKAAKAAGRVYKLSEQDETWPVSHVEDTANLYLTILERILTAASTTPDETAFPPHGKNGYYLAASGSISWNDIYVAAARALYAKNAIESDTVELADENALSNMAKGIGCPKEHLPVQLSGICTLTAAQGKEIGWTPKYPVNHILEVMDDEIALILRNVRDG